MSGLQETRSLHLANWFPDLGAVTYLGSAKVAFSLASSKLMGRCSGQANQR
jgi:hypothetical protein